MRRLRTRITAVISVPVLALALVACGDDGGGGGSEAEARSELSDLFMAEGEMEAMGMDRDAADCMAEAVVDAVGAETVLAASEEGDGDLETIDDPELEEELGMAVTTAMMECLDVDMEEPPEE